MATQFPQFIEQALLQVHSSWLSILREGLEAVYQKNPQYLSDLAQSQFMPTEHRLFAAFSIPFHEVRYVLVGEGPYPREASATGYCFMDGAVELLWSEQAGAGLSKAVNRATSLRNFMKMLLVAEGYLKADQTGIADLSLIALQARKINSSMIQTMADLQNQFLKNGFLMLNAALVFRADVAPAKDAKAWEPLLESVMQALFKRDQANTSNAVKLILWGKIADQLSHIPAVQALPKIKSEHPYNLSFIANEEMQNFFKPLKFLNH